LRKRNRRGGQRDHRPPARCRTVARAWSTDPLRRR
jgi:hypothetical protein